MSEEELKNKIHPPAHIPTEQEHRIAYLTSCLNDIFYGDLMEINLFRTGKFLNVAKNASSITSQIEPALRHVDKIFEKWEEDGDKEIWENMIDYEKFKIDCLKYLSGYHCGDCTAVAASCMRCYAEDLYKIPYTANWNKQEGWSLLNKYQELLAKEKAQ
jgi:hypothetical protein